MPRARRSLVNVLYYGLPFVVGCVGIYRLYRAAQLDGSDAERTFAAGLLLLLCAVGFVAARRCKVRSERDQVWEANQAEMVRRLAKLEKEQAALREDVHSRLALQQWLEIFDRMDAHEAGGWVHLNRPDR
jgi:hypothetical protein